MHRLVYRPASLRYRSPIARTGDANRTCRRARSGPQPWSARQLRLLCPSSSGARYQQRLGSADFSAPRREALCLRRASIFTRSHEALLDTSRAAARSAQPNPPASSDGVRPRVNSSSASGCRASRRRSDRSHARRRCPASPESSSTRASSSFGLSTTSSGAQRASGRQCRSRTRTRERPVLPSTAARRTLACSPSLIEPLRVVDDAHHQLLAQQFQPTARGSPGPPSNRSGAGP